MGRRRKPESLFHTKCMESMQNLIKMTLVQMLGQPQTEITMHHAACSCQSIPPNRNLYL